MKKVIRVAMNAIYLWLLFFAIFVYFTNHLQMFRMQRKLSLTAAFQPGCTVLDSECVYGKLNGNGNGIVFFGAVLVSSESSADVDRVVEKLSSEYELVGSAPQFGTEVTLNSLEHRTVQFEYNYFSENKDYYIIFFFESDPGVVNPFDILGH